MSQQSRPRSRACRSPARRRAGRPGARPGRRGACHRGLHLEPVRVVVPDELVRRVEDGLRRAVVLGQHVGGARRVALAEVEDVRDRGPAELVDALVVVADDGQVRRLARERAHDRELREVRVLELVDEDPRVAPPELARQRRVLAHEAQRQRQEPRKVGEALAGEELEVGALAGGQLGHQRRRLGARGVAFGVRLGRGSRGEGGVRVGGDVLVGEAPEVLDQLVEVLRRVARGAQAIERQRVNVLAQEDDRLGLVEEARLAGQAEQHAELRQQPVPKCVKGEERRVGVAEGHEAIDAFLHLLRRLLGEGEPEHLRRRGLARGDEPGDASREDARLAGARAGEHEHRPITVRDGGALGFVQVVEQASVVEGGGHARHPSRGSGRGAKRLVRAGDGPKVRACPDPRWRPS